LVSNTRIREEITITCKKCGNVQLYHPKSNRLPKRPKTQCQKCSAWIYIRPDLLVINDQGSMTNDQKTQPKRSLKPSIKPAKQGANGMKEKKIDRGSKTNDQRAMTRDQRPKLTNIGIDNDHLLKKEKRGNVIEIVNYLNGLTKEIQYFGQSIPLDKKQSIVIELYEYLPSLIKGVKYYLNAWQSRYERYRKEKPDNPLIDDYKYMLDALKFLERLKQNKKSWR